MLARCPESDVIRDLAHDIGVGRLPFRAAPRRKEPLPHLRGVQIREEMRMRPPDGIPSTFVGNGGCILCGMCVRLCDDVMKIGALAFEGRGMRRRVTTPFRKPSEFCITCGACSSICPTGAIELLRIRRPGARADSVRVRVRAGQSQADLPPVPPSRARACRSSTPTPVSTSRPAAARSAKTTARSRPSTTRSRTRVEEIEVGSDHRRHRLQDLRSASGLPTTGMAFSPTSIRPWKFERLCQRRRPDRRRGHPPRRPDGRKSIGIIHCVGSRDDKTNR